MGFFYHIGRYFIFLGKVFVKPEKIRIYGRQLIKEIENIGFSSIGIVAIISVFIGAVLTIQTGINADTPLLPNYLIALAVRDSIILEFSSTIVALILAGKVGSNIASEIGVMRMSEQIDALEIMGINSAGFIAMPKIFAAVIFNPVLTVISILVGIVGGWVAGFATGVVTSEEYIYGLQYSFKPYYVVYGLIKTVVFAFLITSISAYNGYYVTGGSVEIGKASTKAVVYSSIAILFFNLLLTQFLLT
ncbi:MAG TPA: ABC transporter permease [Bacteroidales bacterium]|nr:ABC transporter permease [Bacteroidales bacterium]